MSDILGRLGQALSLPDADVRFVISLQTAIAGKLQQGNQPPGGQQGPPGQPGQGAPHPPGLQMPGAGSNASNGQPTMQPPQQAPMSGGGLTAGLNPMATQNNPDEMRRVIQQITGG